MTKTTSALAAFSLAMLACLTSQAEAKRTSFTGQEIPLGGTTGRMYANATDWYFFGREFVGQEALSDKRLAGKGYFKYSGAGATNPDMTAGPGLFWGSGRLVPDIGGGEWNGYFVGKVSDVVSMDMMLVGSGDYSGLVAHIIYPAWPAMKGYIVEAKGGPGDRPFQVSSSSTGRMDLQDCIEPTSATAQVLRITIINEVAQATHFGRSSNAGFTVRDPETGELTGTGTVTAANGDLIRWVSSGSFDPIAGLIRGSVHFCSGTGPFDAVVGGFTIGEERSVADPTNPLIVNLFYTGSGTIRY